MKALHHYDLGYANLYVYEQYLINNIKDGVTVSDTHYLALKEIIEKHFPDRKMVYLSNRVSSYTVDPLVHLKVSTIENLAGIGIVTDTNLRAQTALFEGTFSKIPYQVFNTLAEAIVWATMIVKESGNNKDG